jgi:hypothetical protein
VVCSCSTTTTAQFNRQLARFRALSTGENKINRYRRTLVELNRAKRRKIIMPLMLVIASDNLLNFTDFNIVLRSEIFIC